jgi:cytochrome b561
MQMAHHRLIRGIHWLGILLMATVVIAVLLRDQLSARGVKMELLDLHRACGLALAILLIPRIFVWRLLHADMALHRLLMAAVDAHRFLMFLGLSFVALLGLALSSAHGYPNTLFAVIPLPNLLERSPALADVLFDYHLWAAWLTLLLVAGHILAALWHYFIFKDTVLSAMYPEFFQKRRGIPDEQEP